MQQKRVKIVRPFYFERKILEKDKIVVLPLLFAAEMIAAKKAEPVEDEPVASVPAKPAGENGGKGRADK